MNKLALLLIGILLIGIAGAETTIADVGQELLDSFVKTKDALLKDTDIGNDIRTKLENVGLKEVNYDKAEQEATRIANEARALQKQIDAFEKGIQENKPTARSFVWEDGLESW